MNKKAIKSIKTREQAQQIAIDWQHWQSKRNLSYLENSKWHGYFYELAKKFNLIREFKENCIL